jgi:hypothetical protein
MQFQAAEKTAKSFSAADQYEKQLMWKKYKMSLAQLLELDSLTSGRSICA